MAAVRLCRGRLLESRSPVPPGVSGSCVFDDFTAVFDACPQERWMNKVSSHGIDVVTSS